MVVYFMRIMNRLNIVDFEKVESVESAQIPENANVSRCPLIREDIRGYEIWRTNDSVTHSKGGSPSFSGHLLPVIFPDPSSKQYRTSPEDA
jgi:hypothetical protein